MSNHLVKFSGWLWQYIPSQYVRQKIWNGYLWWIRGQQRIETIDGITFDLDMSEMIDVGIHVRRFEKDVADFIDLSCQQGWVVLDIGANIGAHCLRFARSVGAQGSVYAFEPTDYAYSKLRKNVELNEFGNILTYQVALANKNVEQQSISYRSSWRTDGSQNQMSSVVDFVRLDSWMAREIIDQVDLIKIDVDGNEYSVLDGGRELLNKYKPMIIAEVGAWHFVDRLSNPWKILTDLGYRFWDLETKEEYSNLDELKKRLPEEDKVMGFSINVVASTGNRPWGTKE